MRVWEGKRVMAEACGFRERRRRERRRGGLNRMIALGRTACADGFVQ